MRPIDQLLSYLRALDIKLWMEGEHLHYDAPPGTLKQELREELIERKSEVAAALRRMNAQETRIAPQKREGNIPLSFAQARLWFLEQLEPGNPIYNLPSILRLTGAIDKPALAKSLAEIIRRHESLRTVFRTVDGNPVQVVLSQIEFALREIDLTELNESEFQHPLHLVMDRETHWRFDLEKGPLIRATLVRLREHEHLFLLNIHHSVSDGWSLEILSRELSVLYAAFIRGEPSPLPELPVQYADFAIWQRQWLKGKVLEDQLSYWKRQLSGELTMLDLPSDQTRAPLQTHPGKRLERDLPESLYASLRRLSGQQGASLFMVLLAAFKVLLHRHTGKTDLIIGTPIAGRTRSETESLIGFFLNTLVLRTNLAGVKTFREVLDRVREVTLGAYAHQDVPFERLLEELHIKRDLSRTPIFQVFFNMLNFSNQEMKLSGLTVEPVPFAGAGSKFDLTLYVIEHDKHIHLDLVYNTDLFSKNRMNYMLEQYQYLLEQIVAAPEKLIQTYSLVPPQHWKMLPDPSAPLTESSYATICDRMVAITKERADQPAVCYKNTIWTYAELMERAQAIGMELRMQGIQRGDAVAVSGRRCLGLIAALLGTLLSGGVLLPLDLSLPEARRQIMLREAGARFFIQVADEPMEEWTGMGPNDLMIITMYANGCLNKQSQYANVKGMELPVLSPEDPAYIFFTSGSTGKPKGIRGTHKGLAHFLHWQRTTFGIGARDRFAQLTALSFDVVLRDIFTPLTSGAVLCLPEAESYDTQNLLPWMERNQITILHLVPALAALWLQNIPTGTSLPDLRLLFFAGEALRASLVNAWRRQFPSCQEIVNLYGPTETTLAKCFYRVPEKPSGGIQPLGQPLPETQILILNQAGQLCGIGETGEIVIRTPFRTLGYLQAAAAEQKRFVHNPFGNHEQDLLYYTGDLGRYRPDDLVEFLGRADHQVKIHGVRIELEEIETLLTEHVGVKEAVVMARDRLSDLNLRADEKEPSGDNLWLMAYVVPEALSAPSELELRNFLKNKLPEYMLPSLFIFMTALPLLPNGKVDRKALPVQNNRDLASEKDYVAPRTPLEEELMRIWRKVLGVERIVIHDNFFELGGHSLLVAQAIAQIRQALKIEVPVRVFFESPTIAELAEKIEIINWAAGNSKNGIQNTEMRNKEEIRL